jgi:putative ABC transport system permease protein
LGQVLGQGLQQLVVGLAIGLALAYALTLPLGFVFLDVSRTDPATYGMVVVVVSVVSLLAVWFPARRAALIDPLVALRHE